MKDLLVVIHTIIQEDVRRECFLLPKAKLISLMFSNIQRNPRMELNATFS